LHHSLASSSNALFFCPVINKWREDMITEPKQILAIIRLACQDASEEELPELLEAVAPLGIRSREDALRHLEIHFEQLRPLITRIGALRPELPPWPEPLSSESTLPDLPSDLPLPTVLANLAEELSGVLGVPRLAVVLGAATVVGVLIARQSSVHPRPEVDPRWEEPPIIWTLYIAPPGSRKTPLLLHLLREAEEIDTEDWEQYQETLAEWEEAKRQLKRKKKGDKEDVDLGPKPRRGGLTVSDATSAALTERLQAVSSLLCKCDEFKQLVNIWATPSRTEERSLLISCYSGIPVSISRIGRGELKIRRACLGLLGAVQPHPWRLFLKGTEEDLSQADGFVERCLFVVWNLPEKAGVKGLLREETLRLYDQLIRHLLQEVPDFPPKFTLSKEARRILDAFDQELQEELVNEELSELWRQWISKRFGSACRLALILHVFKELELGRSPSTVISSEPAETAIRILKVARKHAARALDVEEDGVELKKAKKLLEWLLKRAKKRERWLDEGFTAWRLLKHHKPWCLRGLSVSDVERLLTILEEHGFLIRVLDAPRATSWKLNPLAEVVRR